MIKLIDRKLICFISLFCFSKTTLYSQTGSTPTGSDTVCVGGISLYQKVYGGIKDDYGYQIAQAADSGYVMIGKTNSFGGGGYDGLLTKINKRGNVVWSKTVGGSGDDELSSINRTSDNGFIVCGSTRSYGNAAGDAWLIKLDAAGTIQWSKKYGDGNSDGQLGTNAVQLSDGGYAMCGIYRWANGSGGVAQSFVVRTDGQGNVLWSKQYTLIGASDDAYGIMEDGNSLLVGGIYNGGSTYMDGYLMKLDKSNGVQQWLRRYDGESRSTWFGQVIKTNTGYQAYSVLTDNFSSQGQQVCIWNLNTDGTVQSIYKVVIPGSTTSSVGWQGFADGSFLVANGENTNNSDVLLTRVNANGTIAWSKKYARAGKQQINAIQTSIEGGYVLIGSNNNAGITADSSNLFVMRVDSTGNAGTCSGVNTTDVTVVVPSYTTPSFPAATADVVITNPVITVNAVNANLTVKTLCNYCSLTPPILPPTGSDTSCTNGISLYQKVYGGIKDDYGYQIAQAADSGYVMIGKTNSFGGGGYDGLLTKINKRGNVVWSKTVGGIGNDELSSINRTSDNGFIVCGATRSFGNAAGDAWLIKLDAAGTIQWSKKYGDGNSDGQLGTNAVQLSDGGYAMCGIYRWANGSGGVAQSFVVRTDGQGNVLWSKQYTLIGASDDAYGIMEDGNSLLVGGIYNGGSTYMDGYLMKLDKSNGVQQWLRRYDGESRSTWFGQVIKTNTGYQAYSVLTDNFSSQGQQVCIWNLNTDGTVQSIYKVVIPGSTTSSVGWQGFADGSFLVANGENTNNSDVLLTRVNANGTIAWSKKYARAGKQQINAIQTSIEGGYVLIGSNNNAGITADSSNLFVMRVDSTGNAGTCSGVNTTDVTVVVPSYTTPSFPAATADVVITNPVITVNAVNANLETSTLCYYCQLQIPVAPPDTSCTNGISLYQKVYGGIKDDYGYQIAQAADSGYVMIGKTNSFGGGGYDGLLTKINKRGNVVWSKTVGGIGNDELSSINRTSDNGFIVCGATRSFGNAAGDAWLIKLDAAGTIQWSKKYGDGNSDGQLGTNAVQLSDGGYAMCGIYRWANGSGGVAQSFVVRTDGQGNVLWSKQYTLIGASDDAYGIMEDGNSLLVGGIYNGGSTYMDGYLMKLDKSNGVQQWLRRYDGESRSTWFGQVIKTNTGYQAYSVLTDNFSSQGQQVCIWNLNTDGTVQSIYKVVIPGSTTSSVGWQGFADGSFLVANGENTNNSDVLLTRVNANGTIAWSKKYARAGKQQINAIQTSIEGGYVLIGSNNNAGITADSSNLFVMRVDSTGNAGTCSGVNTTDVTVVVPSYTTPSFPAATADVVITNPVITVNAVNANLETSTLCFYCQPRPTGTQRVMSNEITQHVLRVYPNPVISGTINLSIEANYDDQAKISVVDIYGNTLYSLAPKEIKKGQNLIQLNQPYRLKNYSNYFIVVQYTNYSDATKIFFIK